MSDVNMTSWFRGVPGSPPPATPLKIDSIDRDNIFGPEEYDAEPGLRDAVNTALLLDQPLLLTGEPGTGKTQLAEKLALELGFPLYKFETKSNSNAQDLFYAFDSIARFQESHQPGSREALDPRRYIEFGALGKAILQSLSPEAAATHFPASNLPAWYLGPGRAVVLIDEVDKAPLDFSNDALNEIERHYFRVREWNGGQEVRANPQYRPVVVVTSNSERQLPDAFLRRCIYYHLPPMSASRLQGIVLRRLKKLKVRAGPMLESALALFELLRSDAVDLRKRPSTAEFLSYVATITQEPGVSFERPVPRDAALRAICTLVKGPEDQESVRRILQESERSS